MVLSERRAQTLDDISYVSFLTRNSLVRFVPRQEKVLDRMHKFFGQSNFCTVGVEEIQIPRVIRHHGGIYCDDLRYGIVDLQFELVLQLVCFLSAYGIWRLLEMKRRL